jgi:hypothetical protein
MLLVVRDLDGVIRLIRSVIESSCCVVDEEFRLLDDRCLLFPPAYLISQSSSLS